MKDRKEQITEYRKQRYTYKEIGEIMKISGQRVSQIEKTKSYNRICICGKLITQIRAGSKFCSKKCTPNSFLLTGRDKIRERVRERDNFTCKDCGLRRTREESKNMNKKSLDVHHLKGLCGKKSKKYDKEKDMKNLITLCHKCHFNRPEHRTKTLEFGISVSNGWSKRNLTDKSI